MGRAKLENVRRTKRFPLMQVAGAVQSTNSSDVACQGAMLPLNKSELLNEFGFGVNGIHTRPKALCMQRVMLGSIRS
eukprot:2224457-Amphidinium_carterae.1